MKIIEMLPGLDDKALATVHANAVRLAEHGTKKQQQDANTALVPIEAEQARREAAKPQPIRPAPRARKPKAAAEPGARTRKSKATTGAASAVPERADH